MLDNIKRIFYQIFKKLKVDKHMDKGMKKTNTTRIQNSTILKQIKI
jgi:hypothetical protein